MILSGQLLGELVFSWRDIILVAEGGGFRPILIIVFGVGLLLSYGLYQSGKADRELATIIENTPLETVESLTAGRTEIKGTVKPLDDTVPEPFGNDECVYAEYRISERVEDNDDTSRNHLASGEKSYPFVVEDETGRIEIDESEMEYSPSTDFINTTTARVGRFPGSEYEAFVKGEKRGWDPSTSSRAMTLDADHKYFKKWLPVDTEVYVFGEAVPNDDESTGEGTNLSQDLKLVPDEKTGRLLISDYEAGVVESRLSRYGTLKWIIGFVFVAVFVLLLADHVIGIPGVTRF